MPDYSLLSSSCGQITQKSDCKNYKTKLGFGLFQIFLATYKPHKNMLYSKHFDFFVVNSSLYTSFSASKYGIYFHCLFVLKTVLVKMSTLNSFTVTKTFQLEVLFDGNAGQTVTLILKMPILLAKS